MNNAVSKEPGALHQFVLVRKLVAVLKVRAHKARIPQEAVIGIS